MECYDAAMWHSARPPTVLGAHLAHDLRTTFFLKLYLGAPAPRVAPWLLAPRVGPESGSLCHGAYMWACGQGRLVRTHRGTRSLSCCGLCVAISNRTRPPLPAVVPHSLQTQAKRKKRSIFPGARPELWSLDGRANPNDANRTPNSPSTFDSSFYSINTPSEFL